MSEKVYIVTSGSYSDYGIYRVFASKENAEKFASMMKCDNVEEWELSDEYLNTKTFIEVFEFTISNGKVQRWYSDVYEGRADADMMLHGLYALYHENDYIVEKPEGVVHLGENWFVTVHLPYYRSTYSRAEKIAFDMIAQEKARENGMI